MNANVFLRESDRSIITRQNLLVLKMPYSRFLNWNKHIRRVHSQLMEISPFPDFNSASSLSERAANWKYISLPDEHIPNFEVLNYIKLADFLRLRLQNCERARRVGNARVVRRNFNCSFIEPWHLNMTFCSGYWMFRKLVKGNNIWLSIAIRKGRISTLEQLVFKNAYNVQANWKKNLTRSW